MWVIMDTATGKTFPQLRRGRGGTWAEFTDGPPRLFKEKRHALDALKWWRDGPWLSDYEGEIYRPRGFERYVAERAAITTIEVVEVELHRV